MSPVPPATSRTLKARLPPRRIEHRHEIVLPQPVQARRHQVVHLVIALGDLGEDLVDEALLLGLADAAEAEGDIVFLLSSVMGTLASSLRFSMALSSPISWRR